MTDPSTEEDDGADEREWTTIFAVRVEGFADPMIDCIWQYETLPEGTTYEQLEQADALAARMTGTPQRHPARIAAAALVHIEMRRRMNMNLTGPWSIRSTGKPTEEDLLAWWRLHGKTTPTAI